MPPTASSRTKRTLGVTIIPGRRSFEEGGPSERARTCEGVKALPCFVSLRLDTHEPPNEARACGVAGARARSTRKPRSKAAKRVAAVRIDADLRKAMGRFEESVPFIEIVPERAMV